MEAVKLYVGTVIILLLLPSASTSAQSVHLFSSDAYHLELRRSDWRVERLWDLHHAEGPGQHIVDGPIDGSYISSLTALTHPGFERVYMVVQTQSRAGPDGLYNYKLLMISLVTYEVLHEMSLPGPLPRPPVLLSRADEDRVYIFYALEPTRDSYIFRITAHDPVNLEDVRTWYASAPFDDQVRRQQGIVLPGLSQAAQFVDDNLLIDRSRLIHLRAEQFWAEWFFIEDFLEKSHRVDLAKYGGTNQETGKFWVIDQVASSQGRRALFVVTNSKLPTQAMLTVDVLSKRVVSELIETPPAKVFLLPGGIDVLTLEKEPKKGKIDPDQQATGVVKIYDSRSGKVRHKYELDALQGRAGLIDVICMSPEGDVVFFRGNEAQLVILELPHGKVTIPPIDFWADAVGGCVWEEEEKEGAS